MHTPKQNPAVTGKKKQPRWRDLTDEEQWKAIYAGRAAKKKSAPKSVAQACGLSLPCYVMHMAIADCHATFQAVVRHDVHTAIVSGIAKVAALLPEKDRSVMAHRLEVSYRRVKAEGLYLHNREFLYAICGATLKLAEDWRYPADSPACMAALMLVEDAHSDEAGDWSLDQKHAVKMVGTAYNSLTQSGLYGKAENVIKGG